MNSDRFAEVGQGQAMNGLKNKLEDFEIHSVVWECLEVLERRCAAAFWTIWSFLRREW